MPPFSLAQISNKLRLCLLDQETGHPLRGVPIRVGLDILNFQLPDTEKPQLIARMALMRAPQNYDNLSESYNFTEIELSLGLLASNHAGYIAFDVASRRQHLSEDQSLYIVRAIYAEVPIDPPLRINLTDQIARTGSTEVIPVSLPGTFADSRFSGRGLSSIQNPDIDDWLLSPGSFGADAVPIIGEDGCEVLLPSHAAERIIRFHRIIRTPSSTEFPASINFSPGPSYEDGEQEPELGWPNQLYYKTGELHHYEMVWLPLNHGLGKVLYSLTLAPCEAVRIAVVDWSRGEEAGRAEQATLSDDLTHSLRRDRTIEEVVNAVLRERQSGESFMGGTAGVGGYGGGFGGGGMGGMPMGGGGTPGASGNGGGGASSGSGGGGQGGGQQAGQNWGVTGSHSIGYAMANSSGDRDVDVETTQDLVDEIAQASHLVRDLRSTVIVQASQRERETVQTRVVRNHNHSHALTILYYEVVRHYLVRSLRRRIQPLIFVKYPTIRFSNTADIRQLIIKNKIIFSAFLKERSLISGIEAIAKIEHANRELDLQFSERVRKIMVSIDTGGHRGGDDRIGAYLVKDDGEIQIITYETPQVGFGRWEKLREGARNVLFYSDDVNIPLSSLRYFGLAWNAEEGFTRWQINALVITAFVQYPNGGQWIEIYRSTEVPAFDFPNDSDIVIPLNVPSILESRRQIAEKEHSVQALITHLDTHRTFYNRVIWLNENADERASRFVNYSYGSIPLIEAIDNRPIDVVGDYVVFPLAENSVPIEAEVLAERIISMPTRGAFAEAKMSHCNASEIIDDTRFWDWQISPCPDEPTEIMPINVGSRRSDLNVTPSTLPSPGVSISDPPSAPEPFGMREVMELLRTPEIFRDMSGIEELGSLLEKLVEVAGEVEKARIGATTELATAGRDTDALSESRSSTPQRTDTPSVDSSDTTSSSPQTVSRQIANAERAISRVENPAVQETLRQEAAGNIVDSIGSSRSSAPRRPRLRERRLSFIFKTDSGLPIRGVYEVIVQNTVDDATRTGATPSPTGNSVRVPIPPDWRTVAITVSIRTVNIVGEGDFVSLQEWVQGITTPFFGTTATPFPLETALEQAVIDPDEDASILFECLFTSRTRTITVEASANVAGEISRSVSLDVAVLAGETGGSVGGSVGGSISTQFELVSLTGRLSVRQRTS